MFHINKKRLPDSAKRKIPMGKIPSPYREKTPNQTPDPGVTVLGAGGVEMGLKVAVLYVKRACFLFIFVLVGLVVWLLRSVVGMFVGLVVVLFPIFLCRVVWLCLGIVLLIRG